MSRGKAPRIATPAGTARRAGDTASDAMAGANASAVAGAKAAAVATVYVVDGDEGLTYLLARYAERAGILLREVHEPPARTRTTGTRTAALWYSSIERLEWARPRETGLGEDMPVIVCASHGEEARARELGADVCAFDPLSYPDFVAALSAVGLSGLPVASVEQGSMR